MGTPFLPRGCRRWLRGHIPVPQAEWQEAHSSLRHSPSAAGVLGLGPGAGGELPPGTQRLVRGRRATLRCAKAPGGQWGGRDQMTQLTRHLFEAQLLRVLQALPGPLLLQFQALWKPRGKRRGGPQGPLVPEAPHPPPPLGSSVRPLGRGSPSAPTPGLPCPAPRSQACVRPPSACMARIFSSADVLVSSCLVRNSWSCCDFTFRSSSST